MVSFKNTGLLPLLLVGIFLLLTSAMAKETNRYVGDDECYLCHKFIKRSTGYLQSSHGKIFTDTPRNALEAKGCESCHGKGGHHSNILAEDEDDTYKGPMLITSLMPNSDAKATNKACLTCHQGGKQMHWSGSMHDMNELSCTACHTLHTKDRKVNQKVCLECHIDVRAKLERSSHMPLGEGNMACTDCHNPHGSPTEGALTMPGINETCYECHADKRGPFLWEHAPVTESCSNCHDPHGSSQRRLLTMRTPYLCQSCHQNIFHPSELYEGGTLASRERYQIKGGCVNCHSRIHGSNHPSGAALTR